MRRSMLACLVLPLALVACSSGNNPKDMGVKGDTLAAKPYFDAKIPTTPVMTVAGSGDGATTVAADLSCLGMAFPGAANTAPVTFSGHVTDYQMSTPVPGATISLYASSDITKAPVATATSQSADGGTGAGAYSITVPIGTKLIDYKVSALAAGQLDTVTVNGTYDPTMTTQMMDLYSVSGFTANALPAITGIERTPGTGLVAARLVDCQSRPIQHAIVVVRDASDNPVVGAIVVYFNNSSSPLPTRRSLQQDTNVNGLFGILQLPATSATVRIEAFGVTSTGGALTKIGDVTIPSLADTVVLSPVSPYKLN